MEQAENCNAVLLVGDVVNMACGVNCRRGEKYSAVSHQYEVL